MNTLLLLAALLAAPGDVRIMDTGLPVSGGALTGALTGTDATFSGAVQGATITATGVVSGASGTLTGSLTLSCSGCAVLLPAGTLGAPSLAWSADADGTGSGIMRSGTNTTAIVANGVARLIVSPTSVQIYQDTLNIDGMVWNSYGVLQLGYAGTSSHSLASHDAMIGEDFEVDGTSYFDGVVHTLTLGAGDIAATCAAGQIYLDTGGATTELCYCTATNTWACWSATTLAGPTD